MPAPRIGLADRVDQWIGRVEASLAAVACALVLVMVVVICADAMSGSRPGARRESAEEYIKRLEALEAIANSFDGVDQSFAVQAGREVRIIVKPERVDDLGASRLARDVSKKIEETMQYPGEIKVTVVRETRASAVAH